LIPLTIIRIVYLNASAESNDHPYDDLTRVMITSVLVNFSIIITAIPFLKPVMDGLQTGILTSDLRSLGGSAMLRSTSYALGPLGKSGASNTDPPSTWRKGAGLGYSATAASIPVERDWRITPGSDRKNEMTIQRRMTVSVQYAEGIPM
jgi:hypothetical protein